MSTRLLRVVHQLGYTLEHMETGVAKRTRLLIYLGLFLVTWLTYWQVAHHDFINFDDPDYVTENPVVERGLTLEGVAWAFSGVHASNWHPVTWLSHMADCQFFGLNAGAQHLVNLLIHSINVILLFLFLESATGARWRSAVVAGLFALHPLHVESVAWIAERKDVLSTFFFLLTLIAYCRYARSRSKADFAWAIVLFILGLMSKPMVVTLPFVLLLLDIWPLKRVELRASADEKSYDAREVWRALVREKWPLFLLTAVFCLITLGAQHHSGAVESFAELSLGMRIANTLVSYVRYVFMMFWPVDLAVFYPLPAAWPIWEVAGAVFLLGGVTFLAVRGVRRYPWLLVGWFWYLGTLVPVIGLVQVGKQALADRYTYIPLIGLFVAIVWSVANGLQHRKNLRVVGGVLAAAVLVCCGVVTHAYLGQWKDSLTLFRHTLAVTHNNAMAHNNLGTALVAVGEEAEALQHYSEAARLDPKNALILNNLANALAREGKTEEATEFYMKAMKLRPRDVETLNNLGAALSRLGRVDDAVFCFEQALRWAPDSVKTLNNLASLLAQQGRHEEAIKRYSQALKLDPTNAMVHVNLGLSLEKVGRVGEAMNHFAMAATAAPDDAESRYQLGRCLVMQGQLAPAAELLSKAVELEPDRARAQFYLGVALMQLGRTDESIKHLRQAIRLQGGWAEPLNALAWILATDTREQFRNGPEAVRLAQQAVDFTKSQQPVFLNTLAAAFAEVGRYDDAIGTADKALKLAKSKGSAGLVSRIERCRKRYEAHQPFRDAATQE